MSRLEELQMAKDMLKDWLSAERAVMSSQEYRMGTKILKRADLSMIGARVKYWSNEVSRLEGSSRIRVRQIVPRDI